MHKPTLFSLEAFEVFDISPLISPRTAVFPGDVPYSASFSMDMNKGDHLTLSSITTTVHMGAHTDAPSHYSSSGSDIAKRDLSRYMGSAQVIEVSVPQGERLQLEDLTVSVQAPRVLFKTRSFPNPDSWNSDFVSLSAKLVDALAAQKVCLVGIDTPSIDLAEDKHLESHQAVARNDMAILEGILLDAVPAGLYQLIALPLRLEGADASPVRAVLLR